MYATKLFTNRRPLVAGIALSLGGAAMGGCFEAAEEKVDPTVLSRADYDEVATAMGSLVADQSRGQASAFGSAADLARGVMPADFSLRGDIVFADKSGIQYGLSAVCTGETGAGVDCGDDAVESHVAVTWAGDWTSGNVSSSAEFDGDWVLADLAEEVLVLDGGASSEGVVAVPAGNDKHPWGIAYVAAYDGIGIDAASGQPVSGVVRYGLTVERRFGLATGEEAGEFQVRAQLTFENDGATLTLDGNKYQVAADGSVRRI